MQTEICKKLGIELPLFAFTHCRDVVVAVRRVVVSLWWKMRFEELLEEMLLSVSEIRSDPYSYSPTRQTASRHHSFPEV